MNNLMKRTLSILTVIAMMLACLPVSASADISSIGIGGGLNGTLSPDRDVEIMVSADKGGQVQFTLTLSDGEAEPRVGGVSLNAPDGNGTYTFDRHFDAGESQILSMSADRETGYSLATKMTREDVVLEEEPAQAEPVAEPVAEPAQEEAAEEPAAEPAQEEAVEEPVAEPAQEEVVEEPAAEPAQEEVVEEPAAEPAQEEVVEEPAEEPAQEEAVEEPVEEPAQEEAAEEPATEPVQEEAAEEPATEPAQEETAEEPAEEPAQEEAAEEPAAEAEETEQQPEAETDEAGESAEPEAEEEIPEFEINGDVLKKYNGEDETVTIPDGIRVIGAKAFAGNKNVTKVILPDTVEIIKNYAFDDCSNLESIVKGPESGLRTIGIGAFQNAAKLDTSFANDVMNVVSNAFELTESGAEEQAETAEETAQAAEEATETVSPDDCSVQISVTWDTEDPQIGDVAHFDSVLTGYESLPYTLQWQTSRDNETWTDYPGATGPQLDVVLTEDMDGVLFRLSVNVESTQEEV